jgi:hypothetical protein
VDYVALVVLAPQGVFMAAVVVVAAPRLQALRALPVPCSLSIDRE